MRRLLRERGDLRAVFAVRPRVLVLVHVSIENANSVRFGRRALLGLPSSLLLRDLCALPRAQRAQ